MKNVKVEGAAWSVKAVASQFENEEQFLNIMMADKDVYPYLPSDKKERSLRLVYKLCVPVSTKDTELIDPEITDPEAPIIPTIEDQNHGDHSGNESSL